MKITGYARNGIRESARCTADDHTEKYHGLVVLSSVIIVLVFSGLPSFVRKILQGEENKGVELTVRPYKFF